MSPLPPVPAETFLLGCRRCAATASTPRCACEQAQQERLAPVLTGLPHDFPEPLTAADRIPLPASPPTGLRCSGADARTLRADRGDQAPRLATACGAHAAASDRATPLARPAEHWPWRGECPSRRGRLRTASRDWPMRRLTSA